MTYYNNCTSSTNLAWVSGPNLQLHSHHFIFLIFISLIIKMPNPHCQSAYQHKVAFGNWQMYEKHFWFAIIQNIVLSALKHDTTNMHNLQLRDTHTSYSNCNYIHCCILLSCWIRMLAWLHYHTAFTRAGNKNITEMTNMLVQMLSIKTFMKIMM